MKALCEARGVPRGVPYTLSGINETTEELKLRRHRLSKACARAGKQLAATVATTVALASAEAESCLEVRCSKCEHAYEAAAVRETVQQQRQRWERLGKACARKEKRAIDAATPAASAAIADADRSTEQALEVQCREVEVVYVTPPGDETVQLRTALEEAARRDHEEAQQGAAATQWTTCSRPRSSRRSRRKAR
jgi:hypothetical protein